MASKIRKVYQIPGYKYEENVCAHNNNFENAKRGILERDFYHEVNGVFEEVQQPDQEEVDKLFCSFSKAMRNVAPRQTPMTPTEFVESYTGKQRVNYQRAKENLSKRGLKKSDFDIDWFLKFEKVNFNEDKHPERTRDPPPRGIKPRRPEANVMIGRYIKPIEKKIYKNIGKVFRKNYHTKGPVVLKGLNAQERGHVIWTKAQRFKKPKFIEMDASRFDQHVTIPLLKQEFGIYLQCYRGEFKDELNRLLQNCMFNKYYCKVHDGFIKAAIVGERMSGDMFTSLGNNVLMTGMIYSMFEGTDLKFDLFVDGDDSVLILEDDADVPDVATHFAKFSMIMKIGRPKHILEEVEFCQGHPVLVGGEYRMVRNFPKCIAKDVISVKPLNTKKTYKGWAQAIGECGSALCSGVPILQEFYKSLQTGVKPLTDPTLLQGSLYWLSRRMEKRYTAIDEDTRYSFYLAFGFTPTLQRYIEQQMPGLPEYGVGGPMDPGRKCPV